MKYQPIGDGILLEKVSKPGTSKGGIVLPPQAKEEIGKGKIVAIGKGYEKEPMHVEVGDEVLYAIRQALPIDDFVLIPQRAIYCKCIDDGIDHVHRIIPVGQVN